MSGSEMIVLAFILMIFGGASGLFTFISLRLMAEKMRARGVYVQVEDRWQRP